MCDWVRRRWQRDWLKGAVLGGTFVLILDSRMEIGEEVKQVCNLSINVAKEPLHSWPAAAAACESKEKSVLLNIGRRDLFLIMYRPKHTNVSMLKHRA